MPSFKNFANGGIDEGLSKEPTSIRHKQVRDSSVGSRIEKVLAMDLERCESREDYEKYISKYGKYESNKYISQARAKIESFDAEEKVKIEREKVTQRVRQNPVVSTPSAGDIGTIPKTNILQTCMKALVWIVIIGGVGLYSYYQYKQNLNDNTTDVEVIQQPSQQEESQDAQEQQTSHTHSEQPYEPDNSIVEPEEPVKLQMGCSVCGQSGRCSVCFGLGSCGGCGGSGQIYSVFYGDEVGTGRFIDCGACGGSGACGACGGSGLCSTCNGQGQVEFEEY